jgi:hypothetical protein
MSEVSHRGLARRRVAVRRRAVLMMPKGERPHPWRPEMRSRQTHCAASQLVLLTPGPSPSTAPIRFFRRV